MKLELMNQANPISITNKFKKTKKQNTINKSNIHLNFESKLKETKVKL